MHILLSAYRCSPYDVSEAYAAFVWLDILTKKYDVLLVTTYENEKDIVNYYKELPSNLRILAFKDSYPLKNNAIIKNSIKLGYIIFNKKLKNYLTKKPDVVKDVDVLFHKSPMSFRYLSCLSNFDKPFIMGPIGGGLKPSKILKHYFKNEGLLYKLRYMDDWLLKHPKYVKQFNKAKYILVTLGYVKEIIDKKYKDKIVEVFDTGIDCNDYNMIDAQEHRKNQEIKILFVGRLVKYKGVELLIKAFAELQKVNNYPKVALDIVGSGVQKNYLTELIQKYDLNNKITLHGNIAKNDVKKFYENASIFCFPSLKEASGNALLEAMSYELPIVTINYGGPKYMCPDEGAIKIPLGSEQDIISELKKGLERLICNDILRIQMGKVNRKHCIENYDWRALEKKIYHIFDNFS